MLLLLRCTPLFRRKKAELLLLLLLTQRSLSHELLLLLRDLLLWLLLAVEKTLLQALQVRLSLLQQQLPLLHRSRCIWKVHGRR